MKTKENHTFLIDRLTDRDIECFQYDGDDAVFGLPINELLRTYTATGEAWVALLDGIPIVTAGYFQVSQGVAHAWMLFNIAARKYDKQITNEIKIRLDEAMQLGKFHRVQTYVVKGNKIFERYATRMGLEQECEVKAMGPNKEDMYIYSKVRY